MSHATCQVDSNAARAPYDAPVSALTALVIEFRMSLNHSSRSTSSETWQDTPARTNQAATRSTSDARLR